MYHAPGVGFGRGLSVGLDVGSGVSLLGVGAIHKDAIGEKEVERMVMKMINTTSYYQGIQVIIILVLPGVGFGRGAAVGSFVGRCVGSLVSSSSSPLLLFPRSSFQSSCSFHLPPPLLLPLPLPLPLPLSPHHSSISS